MGQVVYEIVRHDGGWAYRVQGTYSERFATHDAARSAAENAAREQSLPGESTRISWEDEKGHWHEEMTSTEDRPQTRVEG